jgi:hypothetical protein
MLGFCLSARFDGDPSHKPSSAECSFQQDSG